MQAGAERRLWDAARAALVAVSAAVVCAGAAEAATLTYPAGGSTFDGDVQGWTASDASCGATSGTVLCSASGAYDAAGGNPGGALAVEDDITLNAAGLFTATSTWTSPAFTLPTDAAVTAGGFSFDAALATGGLASLGVASDVDATLDDLTATTTIPLPGVSLDGSAAGFATASGTAPAGALVPGHSYRLVLRTTTDSSTGSVGVLGSARTRLDNVALDVTSADPPAGGGGVTTGSGGGASAGAGSAGGTGTAGGTAITARGGTPRTTVRRGRCTIVGTPHADRLVGTRGRDVVCGLGGNDVLLGRGGDDTLIGGAGRDRLFGGAGRDVLFGGAGRDRLLGGAGRDLLVGGPGADILRGGSGGDRLLGGPGRDVARGTLRHDRVTGVERRRR